MNEPFSHNCDTVGHQPRVFRGGHFTNWRGEKKPSLNMCDMIETATRVKVNGADATMATILDGQIRPTNWKIDCQTEQDEFKDKMQSHKVIWSHIGRTFLQSSADFQVMLRSDGENPKKDRQNG